MERRRIGILGATGTVGQRFIQLLHRHPWFEIAWLAASDRSAGRTFGEACRWKLDTPLPPAIAAMVVQPNLPELSVGDLPHILFAALDADTARDLEPRFAAAGCTVISNSSAFRMTSDVPLVIPEINPGHLALIDQQSWRRESGGCLVTNPNCSIMGLALALKPLSDRFGIEGIFVSTMQAVSGAGYPGVPSLDILGNVIPFVANEEEKMQEEFGKILGSVSGKRIQPHPARLSAHCNRVAVEDGHTECVSVKLSRPATREEILDAWSTFAPLAQDHLPSAPDQPLLYNESLDRPQPRLDRMAGAGMAVTIGRLRPCALLDWKFVLLSHNTLRGAAGAAVLNAELLARMGRLPTVHASAPQPALAGAARA